MGWQGMLGHTAEDSPYSRPAQRWVIMYLTIHCKLLHNQSGTLWRSPVITLTSIAMSGLCTSGTLAPVHHHHHHHHHHHQTTNLSHIGSRATCVVPSHIKRATRTLGDTACMLLLT
jgi:hypothetical protein